MSGAGGIIPDIGLRTRMVEKKENGDLNDEIIMNS